MTIEAPDQTIVQPCFECDTSCVSEGCNKLVAIAPCSVIHEGNGVYKDPASFVFTDDWCRVTQLTTATYAPNQTIKSRGFVGEKFEHQRTGQKRPTLELDVLYCKSAPAHRLLNKSCLIAFMMMENRADYVPGVSPTQLPCVRYGMALPSCPDETSEFDEDESRVYTLYVHQAMWEYNMDGQVPNAIRTSATREVES